MEIIETVTSADAQWGLIKGMAGAHASKRMYCVNENWNRLKQLRERVAHTPERHDEDGAHTVHAEPEFELAATPDPVPEPDSLSVDPAPVEAEALPKEAELVEPAPSEPAPALAKEPPAANRKTYAFRTDREGEIGSIVQVTGAAAVAVCDPATMNWALDDPDTRFMSAGQIGSIVKICVPTGYVFATVRKVRAAENRGEASVSGDPASNKVIVDLDFMGHQSFVEDVNGSSFLRGIAEFPIPGQKVLMITSHEMESIFASEGVDQIQVGTVYPHHLTPAIMLADHLLSKHFAILGSTGTGKSCTLALVLHRLIEKLPSGHIILLDPHDEYGRAFGHQAERFNTDNLQLPYWLMNFEEHVEVFVGRNAEGREVEVDILKRCLLAARTKDLRNRSLARVTVDTPVPYKITDLTQTIDNEMGRLEKPERVLPYLRLKSKIDELRKDQRYGFMFSGLLLHDNLADILSRLLRFPVSGKPLSIIDLSAVPGDIVDVVVGVLCRAVFDFALWSRGDNARPILLVCEEAHRYIPGDDKGRNSSARKGIQRIAKEGRKYGVSLGLDIPAPGGPVRIGAIPVRHHPGHAHEQRSRPDLCRTRPSRRGRRFSGGPAVAEKSRGDHCGRGRQGAGSRSAGPASRGPAAVQRQPSFLGPLAGRYPELQNRAGRGLGLAHAVELTTRSFRA